MSREEKVFMTPIYTITLRYLYSNEKQEVGFLATLKRNASGDEIVSQ